MVKESNCIRHTLTNSNCLELDFGPVDRVSQHFADVDVDQPKRDLICRACLANWLCARKAATNMVYYMAIVSRKGGLEESTGKALLHGSM